MNYAALTPAQKVDFYNYLSEEPFTGKLDSAVQQTAALLKSSGWSLDEINDSFKQFIEESKLSDGSPSKCTMDLGLEPSPTPAKRGRPKKVVQEAKPEPEPEAEAEEGQAEAEPAKPKKTGRGSGLIPKEPKIEMGQMIYVGPKKVRGIGGEFQSMIGEGCTMQQLIKRYEDKGVSSSARNVDSATAFVRGYINHGLKEKVGWYSREPVENPASE